MHSLKLGHFRILLKRSAACTRLEIEMSADPQASPHRTLSYFAFSDAQVSPNQLHHPQYQKLNFM